MELATFLPIIKPYSARSIGFIVKVDWRDLRFLVLICCLFAAPLVCDAHSAPYQANSEIQTIDQASFIYHDHDLPPSMHHADWQSIALPDLWQHSHRDYGGNIWYRMSLKLDTLPSQLWAIYLPRVSMNAAVWVNGVMVGSGGSFVQPMARNWNRPLYFTIPATLWHVGDNTILMRVQADKNCRGTLYPDWIWQCDQRYENSQISFYPPWG